MVVKKRVYYAGSGSIKGGFLPLSSIMDVIKLGEDVGKNSLPLISGVKDVYTAITSKPKRVTKYDDLLNDNDEEEYLLRKEREKAALVAKKIRDLVKKEKHGKGLEYYK